MMTPEFWYGWAAAMVGCFLGRAISEYRARRRFAREFRRLFP